MPAPYRLRGGYAWGAGAVMAVTVGFGVFTGVAGIVS